MTVFKLNEYKVKLVNKGSNSIGLTLIMHYNNMRATQAHEITIYLKIL